MVPVCRNPFNQQVLAALVCRLNFDDMVFDDGLRHFLSFFVLPKEAQQIDRIIEQFARRYFENNPAIFKSSDAAYILAFAIIMLNTDAHNPKIKKRMTKEQFIKNLRGINDNENLDEEFLGGIYERIVSKEITMKSVTDLMDEEEYRDMFVKGISFLKHGRRGKPHPRLIAISEDGTQVSWQIASSTAKKYMNLSDVVGVHKGASTAVFKRNRDIEDRDKLCFSLIGKERTLDLEAPTEQIRDLWCDHFRLIVDRNECEECLLFSDWFLTWGSS